jgi:hypothetical protein
MNAIVLVGGPIRIVANAEVITGSQNLSAQSVIDSG